MTTYEQLKKKSTCNFKYISQLWDLIATTISSLLPVEQL